MNELNHFSHAHALAESRSSLSAHDDDCLLKHKLTASQLKSLLAEFLALRAAEAAPVPTAADTQPAAQPPVVQCNSAAVAPAEPASVQQDELLPSCSSAPAADEATAMAGSCAPVAEPAAEASSASPAVQSLPAAAAPHPDSATKRAPPRINSAFFRASLAALNAPQPTAAALQQAQAAPEPLGAAFARSFTCQAVLVATLAVPACQLQPDDVAVLQRARSDVPTALAGMPGGAMPLPARIKA